MQFRWLIVDGYSLLHRDPEFAGALKSNLQLARRQLVKKLERNALAGRVTVVFDGQQAGRGHATEVSPIEVIFSPAHQTADTVIERLVGSAPDPEGILVVTADRAERETVTAAGAQAMSCAAFLDQLSVDRAQVSHKIRTQTKSGKSTLGDFFPK